MKLSRLLVATLGILLLSLASLAEAEIAQKGNLRVAFQGSISPSALPRGGTAPIAVSLGGQVLTTDGSEPPQLQTIKIALNRAGRIDYGSLPACRLDQIQPATTQNAVRACAASKVGEGSFAANVAIPQQSPFPSTGRLIAFNGVEDGRPVIFAHVYGTEPLPTSFTLPMRISKTPGTYGTVLEAALPSVTASVAFVTAISMKLDRTFYVAGKRRGYVSAGCPAPKGFPGATFPLARASFAFADGRILTSTLNRSCRAR